MKANFLPPQDFVSVMQGQIATRWNFNSDIESSEVRFRDSIKGNDAYIKEGNFYAWNDF